MKKLSAPARCVKELRHIAEAGAAYGFYWLFRLLPLDAASALGGMFGRNLGPLTAAHKVALRNIRRTFPDMPAERAEEIALGMWENLGRTAGEFPHVPSFDLDRRVAMTGADIIEKAGKTVPGTIFFTAHLGNWELLPTLTAKHGAPVTAVYRRMNNPYVDALVKKTRLRANAVACVPKGREGARDLLTAVRSGKCICMLTDQKMNDGIAASFMGREAMTAPAIAHFALKYGCALAPMRVLRVKGCRFSCDVMEPLDIGADKLVPPDEKSVVEAVNRVYEEWIRSNPEQWFWVHRRWPD
ncbi:MAG: hypothetical protein ABW189_00990 [Rickettsiales bacterium]